MVAADEHNLSVHDEYVAVLQEAILISSCGDFCASCRLASSRVDEKQQKLKKPIDLPQVPTHMAMVPSAISPHLLTDITPDQPLNNPLKSTT